jgi:hypothetical protein
MLDQIPMEVTNHSKARTGGVSSSDLLGAGKVVFSWRCAARLQVSALPSALVVASRVSI